MRIFNDLRCGKMDEEQIEDRGSELKCESGFATGMQRRNEWWKRICGKEWSVRM